MAGTPKQKRGLCVECGLILPRNDEYCGDCWTVELTGQESNLPPHRQELGVDFGGGQ